MNTMNRCRADMPQRYAEHRAFLAGGPKTRPFVSLDPSSYAAVHAGRPGGHPTTEEEVAFHLDFPNDARVGTGMDWGVHVPELRWQRKHLRDEPDGTVVWEETLPTPQGVRRRVVADQPGTTPWLIEPAVTSPDEFSLIEFYAERIREAAGDMAQTLAAEPDRLRGLGIMPGATTLSPFEVYYLIDYPDMPLLFMDHPDAYLRAIKAVHETNLELMRALSGVGFELFISGSAGLELLSPTIFHKAIVPFQSEFSRTARDLGVFTSYHICGHSKGLIEMGIIDALAPTIFETCSAPPCGNNDDLRTAVQGIDESIITKGNLALELMAEGAPEEIRDEVARIHEATHDRRHIIGQADGTILAHTPHENIRAFLDAVAGLTA